MRVWQQAESTVQVVGESTAQVVGESAAQVGLAVVGEETAAGSEVGTVDLKPITLLTPNFMPMVAAVLGIVAFVADMPPMLASSYPE